MKRLKNKVIDGEFVKHRKEHNFYKSASLIVCHAGEIRPLINAFFYRTKTKNTCIVWVKDRKNNFYFSGADWASGYGYNRETACINSLFKANDLLQEDHLHAEIHSLFERFARRQGYKKFFIDVNAG